MFTDFPNDDDGDVLRLVLRDGSDRTKPMFIDFHVAMPGDDSAKSLADVARKLGHRAEIYDSAECRLPWTFQCSTRMLATYEGVLAVQAELARLIAPLIERTLGWFPDGWGTFGNGPNGQPDVR